MFKSIFTTVFGAVLGIASLGPASGEVSNPGQVYKKVDTLVVLSILGEMGYAASISQAEGLTFITATKAGARPLVMSAAPCGDAAMPDCSVFMVMGFAPISILPGATNADRMATLAVINAYEQFLTVKFAIMDPSLLSGLRTELYPYGGTRGNISMSIETVARVSALAFSKLTSMAGSTPGFSGVLESPLGAKGEGSSVTVTFGALQAAVPVSKIAPTAQSLAAQKTINVIRNLVRSKTFRQDLLISE